MLRSKKPWLIPSLLAVYATGMFIYLIPRNHEAGMTEKMITVVSTYAVLIILYLLLKKKDKMARDRENDLKK